jgi:hypothetical protein
MHRDRSVLDLDQVNSAAISDDSRLSGRSAAVADAIVIFEARTLDPGRSFVRLRRTGRRLPSNADTSRDWIKLGNPKSPAMSRAKDAFSEPAGT